MRKYKVLDLFSGAGGMSAGFHFHPRFEVIGAVDRENGKPSSGEGKLECNKTYEKNIGIKPMSADLSKVSCEQIQAYLDENNDDTDVDILISCAPCTGFSKTIRKNLVTDDPRNSLVQRSTEFVEFFSPKIFVMENVGELLKGKSSHHFELLEQKLNFLGYKVHADVHSLDNFGLPQKRKRALIIACKSPELTLHTIEELWEGFRVSDEAVTVRRAISDFPPIKAGETHPSIPNHVSPSFSEISMKRFKATPHDGGEWVDWLNDKEAEELLIPSMKRYSDQGKVGPYRDVYGRMWWDKPSITLKRECSHVGNGRYSHPEQNRLCSVREMASLQGFPMDYVIEANSLSNKYRHIGDSVPPMISYQIAHVCDWTLSGKKPNIRDVVLENTSLKIEDILETEAEPTQLELAS